MKRKHKLNYIQINDHFYKSISLIIWIVIVSRWKSIILQIFKFLSSDKEHLYIPKGHFTIFDNPSVDGPFPKLNANKKTWKIDPNHDKQESGMRKWVIYFVSIFPLEVLLLKTVEIKNCEFLVRCKSYMKFNIFVAIGYFTTTTINLLLTIIIKLFSHFE